MNKEERLELISKCKDINCICQDCMYLEFVKNNVLKQLEQENKQLKERIRINQEHPFLSNKRFYVEDIKNWKKESQKLQQRINEAIEYINRLEKYPMLTRYNCLEILEILKGGSNE